MKLFHLGTLRAPVRKFAALAAYLAWTCNPAFAIPIFDIDTQSGFVGTNADDTIFDLGLLDVLAEADALGIDFPLFGSGVFDNSVTAVAQASGIDALAGEDIVGIADPVTTTATATATGAAADGSLAGDASADISVNAISNSTGVDGGDDDDEIINADVISADASAQAAAVSATLTLDGGVTNNGDPGDALVEAGTTSDTEATGIAGGSGVDTILSATRINATTESTTTAVIAGFSVAVSIDGDVTAGAAVSDASSLASTRATGIDGGADDDTIGSEEEYITGGIVLSADSTATGVAASFSVAGSVSGDPAAGDALSEARTDADAEATGIAGGGGSDTIRSATGIDAEALATATAVSGDFSVAVGIEGDVTAGAAVSDASSLAASRSTGIDGGEGNDAITSIAEGDDIIDLFAKSTATGVAASFTVAGSAKGGATSGDALSEARTDADAEATGIAGGSGVDTILSATRINATTESTATAVSAGFTVAVSKEDDVTSGNAMSDASSLASTRATGIDGGADDDTIGREEEYITGGIVLSADSTATGVAASFTVAGSAEGGATSGDALSEARTDADAEATGIAGGGGSDTIRSATGIDAEALATATAVSGDFSVAVGIEGDVTAGAAVSDASSLAASRSTGIDGGEGNDAITSIAEGDDIIDLFAKSTATGVAASFTVAGSAKGGATSGDALSEARTDADAEATGIAGGSGVDTILSATRINAITESTATAVSAGFTVAVSKEDDVTSGNAMSDASSLASTRATGIDGGADDDTIGREEEYITGGIVLSADSTATGVAASFSVAGSVAGDPAAGDALSEARTDADAEATGIAGGGGGDIILSDTSIDATATAMATAVSAGFSVEITKGGDTEGEVSGAAAMSDASSLAASRSTGIDGGEGGDTITSVAKGDDIIDLFAKSTATGVAASVTVSGQLQGDVATGGALSEASTMAESTASAIDSGGGDDVITNATDVIATTDATATGVSVGVFVGITGDGDITNTEAEAAGAALSDASSVANATTTGISSGDGVDDVWNSGEFGLLANSHATGVAVSLSVAGSASGDVEGGAVSDASVVAESYATGIDGGYGRDSIFNQGAIHLMDEEAGSADADADAIATAVAISLAVSGSLDGDVSGEALSDASATAVAFATGIAGGAGIDSIENWGRIIADVGAETTTVAVSVEASITKEGNASGASLSDSSATALAAASGIDGGDDGDDIDNRADIDITTDAESDSVSVSVALAGSMDGVASGEAMANASADSIARSVGITGGSGDDDIDMADESFDVNELSIHTHSRANAAATAVSVTLAGAVGAANGAAVADASATGESFSTGIDGGSGEDVINNTSAVEATAEADATASSTTVMVTISAGAADSVGTGDSGATARATTAGIDGGDDGDTITNAATIYAGASGNTPMAMAEASSTTIDVGITLGEAESSVASNAAALAEANALGISGGAGDDVIVNTGLITVGTREPDETSEPLALALAGSQTVKVGVNFGEAASAAASDSSSTAFSDITGIAGGGGIDTIDNSGDISAFSSASARSTSNTTDVTLSLGISEGSSASDAASQSMAFGTGIDGGSADDDITTGGDLNVEARSVAFSESSTLSLKILSLGSSAQTAAANSSSTADAIARGVFGNEGNDTISTSGKVTVSTDSDVDSKSRSSVVSGLAVGEVEQHATSRAETTAYALATGIDGGIGNDFVDNGAEVDVSSTANATSSGVAATNSGFNLAGSSSGESMSDARATVLAESIGIFGGANELAAGETDTDTIVTSMPVDVSAEATGQSESKAETEVTAIFGSVDGTAVADASAVVLAKGVGIDGGAGADTITTTNIVAGEQTGSQGNVTVTANAETAVTSTSTVEGDVTFGNASTMGASDASVDMLSESFGINAGSGADTVMIDSLVDVSATSDGEVTSTSNANADTTFGDATSGAMSDASAMRQAKASGLVGGDGNDMITTSGDTQISVMALSSGAVNSSSYANADSTFGDASSNTVSAASSQGIAETIGIAGGNGNDDITNLGRVATSSDVSLTVTSRSIAKADSGIFGDSYAGAASDTSIAGRATSMGINGEGGINSLETRGALNVNARSETIVTNMTAALAESETVASSRNSASSEVVAIGIDGGEGVDTITTGGQVAVAGESNITVTVLTVSSSGDASSDARTLATAEVSGVSSGAADDVIMSNGGMLVAAAPKVGISERTFGENVDGNVGITLQADASGIDAGAGTDSVNNNGSLLVVVGRQSDSTAEVGTDSETEELVLIDDQRIHQDADEIIGKWLRIDLKDGKVMFSIIESFDPATGAITLSDPIPVDQGANTSYTLFDVDDAGADIAASTVTIGGRVRVEAATEGNVTASGITGGVGDDTITNNGDVAVRGSNFTEAGTRTVSGNIQSDLSTRSNVFAIGIDGDTPDPEVPGGADLLNNFGDVDVKAFSGIDLAGSVLSYAGQSQIDAAGMASATAIGLRGGRMGDTVVHTGNLGVTSEALVLAEESARTVFSDIRQKLDYVAAGESVGVSAGDGDDVVMSSGIVGVSGTAAGSVTGATTTDPFFNIFFGIFEPRTENVVDVVLDGTSYGLDLGAGSDVVENRGDLTVRALAVPIGADVARAESEANRNETGARATAENTAVATGIRGEDGAHQVANSGAVDVGARAVATTFAQAAELLTADDQSTISDIEPPFQFTDDTLVGTELDFEGKELRLADTDEGFPRREGTVTAVDSDLSSNQFKDDTAEDLEPEFVVGTHVRFVSNDPAVSGFMSEVTAFDPDTLVFTLADTLPVDVVVDDGYVLSVLTTTVTDFDQASGTYTLDEQVPADAAGAAYTLSLVSAGQSADVNTFVDETRIGEDDTSLENNWVAFSSDPDFFAFVQDFDEITGRFTLDRDIPFTLLANDIYELSTTRDGASGSTAFARATGIDLGGGDAIVINSAPIGVNAAAIARTEVIATRGLGEARADGVAEAVGVRTRDGNDSVGNLDAGSLTVIATVSVNSSTDVQSAEALAVGIDAGDGANRIDNSGAIDVRASLLDEDDVVMAGNSFQVAASADVAASRAEAWGVRTGSGQDSVVNAGAVLVTAEVSDAAAGAGAEARAVGISTGDGDDTLLNAGAGSVSASTTIAGITTPATAISTGAGQDQLSLLDQSSITGLIDLGPGEDLLTLAGAATVAGTVTGSDGTDTVRLEDRGSFFLPELQENEHYQVDQGTLEVGEDMAIPVDGSFRAEIYNPAIAEPGFGQLVVGGVATLGGTANVTTQPRIFIDGEVFPLLVAGQFNNGFQAFDTVNLPPGSALVNFGFGYRFDIAGRDLFEVTTAVDPFRTVARHSLQRTVAGYLERIAPTASGDLAEVIGTFQLLPRDANFDTAFTSLSPDTHDNYTQATFFGVSQYQETLSRRLRARRVDRMLGGTSSRQAGFETDRSLLLAYSGDNRDIRAMYAGEVTEVPAWWRDVWITAFGQWGDQDGEDGYTGFDYDVKGLTLGIDHSVSDRLLLGASAAYTDTDVDQDRGRGDGDIDGWMASLYGSYSLDKAYVDGALSYGKNDYDAKRKVRVGTIQRTARSDHDGDVFAASLGSGYPISREDTVLEPFGRLQYIRIDEDAFTESGADSVNQRISSRDTDSLTSEIGVRVRRVYEKAAGWLTTDASVAWLHDFDIDDRTITTSYTGTSAGSFSMPGQDVERNGVTLGLGVGFETRKGVSTSLNYNGEFRDGFSAHGVMGRISYRF